MGIKYLKHDTNGDVLVFNAPNSGFIARFPSYYSNKPTKRNKYLTLNCARYTIIWME